MDRLAVSLVGRSSSHFTRVAALYAHELGVPFELTVVHDVLGLDAAVYSEVDLACTKGREGAWVFTHKDGRGW